MPAPGPPLPVELETLLPASLRALCEARRVERGARLFETGRRPLHMHFVCEGEVVLQRIGDDGELVVLQRTRHGFVAEASLQSARYHCDARAATDAYVVRIPRQAVLDVLDSDTAFAMRWIGMLNNEVRRLRQQCERLSLKTVEARLLHLVRTEGGPSGLPIGPGLKTLAREIGVTHEALYRGVAALRTRGLLARADGWLRLPGGPIATGSPAHPTSTVEALGATRARRPRSA